MPKLCGNPAVSRHIALVVVVLVLVQTCHTIRL
jgi:hypothetical protein